MGDPVRAFQAAAIINEIESKDLLNNVKQVGAYLQDQLPHLNKDKIQSVRGQGTFIAFDLPTAAQRDKLLLDIRQLGVNLGGCGDRTVRLRPMLTFQKHHADILLDSLDQALKK